VGRAPCEAKRRLSARNLFEFSVNMDQQNIPAHVAIIMDGNGRWAQKKGMLRVMGHRQGVRTVKEIVRAAPEVGVKIHTLYAFTT
jgi:undecaprenyl diphosphate synthase